MTGLIYCDDFVSSARVRRASAYPPPFSRPIEPPVLPPRNVHTASALALGHLRSLRRLPLRGLGDGGTLSDQLLVSQATSDDGVKHAEESPAIVVAALVEPKR